eukprot:INCI13430.2.p1 GENE.INCI13430.2~~INCI13430.2.p1  ORF type:complete len:254 (+),score=46.80 INCI13430.2:562-1323(+)
METCALETDLATKLAEAENQLSVLQQASAASAAEHENLQTAFVAAQQALVEARSDLQQTEAAHAASKAELEARVSNALSKSIADEAQSQALRERNASLEQQLALATKLAEARNQSITPPPTIAVRSPSRSKSPASSNSRWHSGSASRSSVPPSPGGSAGSSSKQRSRLARVKTGATPRQSPRPGVGFGSRSDRGLSPARRGSLSSSGTPGTPGSVERRSPRLWYERKRRTPKLKYDSKSLNTHTHVDPNAVWQ